MVNCAIYNGVAQCGAMADGPDFLITANITNKTLVNIIDRLRGIFGDQYDFEPLATCEGGIEVTKWPGQVEGQHKSFRWCRGALDPISHKTSKWPWISDSAVEDWRTGPEFTIIKGMHEDDTYIEEKKRPTRRQRTNLRVCEGAYWTYAEVAGFIRAFQSVGIYCTKYPRNVNKLKNYVSACVHPTEEDHTDKKSRLC
jgi:hypothetical protein